MEPRESRPPFILWRFVTFELWRLLLLTAWVFVSVIAFAATIKPLAEGKLGPLDALKFMGLAIPPMLQYALPFAAGFGATLAYHRLASDNEVTACHAGGISHRAMLMPAAISGLVLAGVLFVLSNSAIPRFLRSMEELVTVDATRLLVNSINRAEPVRFEDLMIYADYVAEKDPPEGSKALKLLYLKGLLVVRLGPDASVDWELASREAWVTLFARTGEGDASEQSRATRTMGQIRPLDFTFRNAETKTTEGDVTIPFEIPNAFSDDPKFLTWTELSELRAHPARMNWIEDRRSRLAAHLMQRETLVVLDVAMREGGVAPLDGPNGARLLVRSSRLGPWERERGHRLIPPREGDPIRIERISADGVSYIHDARRAWLDVIASADEEDGRVQIVLLLEEYMTRSGDVQTGMQRSLTIPKLRSATAATEPLFDRSCDELIGIADRMLASSPSDEYVKSPRDDLVNRLGSLMREITSKQQERIAMSVACLVMIITGAVMAMRLRGSVPLVVYLWSFFPALGAVITVSAGQQAIHEYGWLGLPIMWGGVAALTVYTFVEYRRLAQH